ncbi:hypothetical protein SAMD00020551_1068 [Mesobacillus selenatarsenatis SF-1]|uniref:Uncharacterized protein n=1 Tax=Mesobacillus selenatarsenatis (strain DSM 18680 / JCM 14380 / FERM P-15431 / SF-1) TaxID=1321606 RepID=A0A0A8WZ76_MESS1|nr:hypothetical protein SAMD00020551_1068 [Mesobacillus selenatarsenatis SF-1]
MLPFSPDSFTYHTYDKEYHLINKVLSCSFHPSFTPSARINSV